MTDRRDSPTHATTPLTRAGRVTPASVWATFAAGAAVALGGVWLAAALVRPLPAPPVPVGSFAPPVRLARSPGSGSTVVGAEALARLSAMGNIFAPDRAPWPASTLADAEPDPADADAPAAPPPPVTASSSDARPPAYETIAVERTPPPAIDRELKALHLRGVFRTPAGAAAVIQDAQATDARGRALLLRAGQAFREGAWRVVAIDADGRRVILSRSGVNVELSLYDVPPGAAIVQPPRAGVAPLAPPAVVVRTRTPEQARADLLAAGLTAAEADELLSLAQQADASPAVAATPEPAVPALQGAPAISDDMRALLEMMATGAKPPGGN